MNNIFENAYFGKSYKTRDGRKAIYWKYEPLERWHILIMENSLLTAVLSDGKMCSQINCGRDIVSEWQEEINVEAFKELTKKVRLIK